MTALVLSRPSFSWPRVTAWSGTLSLHALLIGLLLVPPVALKLTRSAPDETIDIRIVDPPPQQQIPVEPVPPKIKHEVKHPPTPPVTAPRTPVTAPPADTPNTNPVPAEPEPGRADIAPPVDTAPTALAYNTRTKVPYPRDALQRREHGTVKLRVLIGVDGAVQKIEILASSGSPRLDRAAREAVEKWTFQPGTRGGVAYAAWAIVPITFDFQTL